MNKFYLIILILALIVVGFVAYPLVKDSFSQLTSSQFPLNGAAVQDPNSQEDPSNAPTTVISPSESSTLAESPSDGVDEFLQPHYCAADSRDIECDESQQVVCGWFAEQEASCEGPCVKFYVNPCQACSDTRVEYWTGGDCPIHG